MKYILIFIVSLVIVILESRIENVSKPDNTTYSNNKVDSSKINNNDKLVSVKLDSNKSSNSSKKYYVEEERKMKRGVQIINDEPNQLLKNLYQGSGGS